MGPPFDSWDGVEYGSAAEGVAPRVVVCVCCCDSDIRPFAFAFFLPFLRTSMALVRVQQYDPALQGAWH
jgi:hypothetical protein